MIQEMSDAPEEPFVPSPENTSGAQSFYADKRIEFNYDIDAAPKNKKLTLLTIGRIAVQGILYGDSRDDDTLGWFPLPARNRTKEQERLKQLAVKSRAKA